MDPKGAAIVRAYHSERISRFGVASAKSLGWRDEHAQSQRFKQTNCNLNENDADIVVVMATCLVLSAKLTSINLHGLD